MSLIKDDNRKYPLDLVIGRLHRLWWWCLEYAEDGDLSRYSIDQISELLNLDAQALVDARWIDTEPYRRIHDWWDHAGHFLKSKYKNYPEKWQRIESLYAVKKDTPPEGIPTTIPNTSPKTIPKRSESIPNTHPKTALHNITIHNQSIYTRNFDQLWAKYPLKDGRKEAERHFNSTVKTQEDFEAIQKALDNYLKHLALETWKKPKNGSTWFNNWRDWVNWTNESVILEPSEETKQKLEDKNQEIRELAEREYAKRRKGD